MTEHSADGSDTVTLRFGHEELIVRRRYEVASIVNDLLVALWFTVGSVLFFWEDTVTIGTVAFLLGSVQLAGRPLIRLHRRLVLRRFRPEAPGETARDF